MPEGYSTTDLLDFLEHAAQRGVMPAATAQSLAVACRTIFQILSEKERGDLRRLDLDAVTLRFAKKRARDFSAGTMEDYVSRLRRAVTIFLGWRGDPAHFRIPTRAGRGGRGHTQPPIAVAGTGTDTGSEYTMVADAGPLSGGARASLPVSRGGYQTVVPLRPGHLITIANVPEDLSGEEAERLAQFVRMLAVQQD